MLNYTRLLNDEAAFAAFINPEPRFKHMPSRVSAPAKSSRELATAMRLNKTTY